MQSLDIIAGYYRAPDLVPREAIVVTSLPRLDISDGDHIHTAGSLALGQLHNLAVNDAYNRHIGDNVRVEHIGESFGRVYATMVVSLGSRYVVNLTPERRNF